ncbi:hypothetical protein SAMN05216359_101713 [Roseateles sp. YR242]|uniref:hypothetical protein n=1 Tax=Roseateles sp. YR242 TaxID=1855305 RepID=UPI0008C4A8F0|nr:hypothetical protein [Roseateles sp. YR242]SEK40434.1 hypothetical protein SAMN05216359_101713 [Roseateles sp. YR242]
MHKTAGIGLTGLMTFVIVFLALLGLHLPFVASDAEASLGFSRGPFTDEGLYTAQVRNAMRTGVLDMAESDGVIKEPLFSLFAWGVLTVFGDSWLVMRAAMLALSSALLAVLVTGRSPLCRAVLVGLPVVALSYYPFHYGHLALVEMTASLLIIGALWGVQQRLNGGSAWALVLSALLIFLAYSMKVQFVYAAAIPPVALVLAWGMNVSVGRGLDRPTARRALVDVVGASVAAVGFAAVFVLGWYLPNRALMSFVLGAQTSRRSSSLEQLVASVRDNLHMLATDRRIWAVWLALVVGLVVAVVAWRALRRAVRAAAGRRAVQLQAEAAWGDFVGLMAPTAAWALIELHKVTLSYLPSRYFLPLIMALGLLGAAGMYAAWRWGRRSRVPGPERGAGAGRGGWEGRRWASVSLAGVLGLTLVLDARDYANAHQRRAYVIRDTQAALAAEGRWENQLVMGPWAATLFWGSGAITKPVWKDYFNDGPRIQALRPVVLVSEPDQEDSERGFENSGMVMAEPPLRSVKVRDWTVNVYAASERRTANGAVQLP